jgi:hypothetical protein
MLALCAFACKLYIYKKKVLEQKNGKKKKCKSLKIIKKNVNFCERTQLIKTPCMKYHKVYVIDTHVKLILKFVNVKFWSLVDKEL